MKYVLITHLLLLQAFTVLKTSGAVYRFILCIFLMSHGILSMSTVLLLKLLNGFDCNVKLDYFKFCGALREPSIQKEKRNP